MRSRTYYSALLLLCALLAAGCTTVRFPERERLQCPVPPPPVCSPTRFSEVTIDTSMNAGSTQYHLAITQVEGLNKGEDEFGVQFQSRNGGLAGALATIRSKREGARGGQEEITTVRFREVDDAKIERVVPVATLDGSIGGGARTAGNDTILFAAKERGNVAGDYDLFSGSYRSESIAAPALSRISSVIAWDAQPAISRDGRFLYFASDRSNGFGGTDIYVSKREPDGSWGESHNVGAAVNTPCDELSPYVSGDGKWLYFSSAGHATVGGYDLFRAPIAGEQIGKAENLGKPINTPADELFPSAPADADPDTLLYYSSNQPGSRGFDMYVLHRVKKNVKVLAAKPRSVTLTGTVRNANGRPVDSARVTIEERDPPGEKDSTITNRDGKYQIEVKEGKKYEIIAGSDSTLYFREEVRIPIGNGGNDVKHDITIADTITFRVNFPFNNATEPYEFTLDDRGMPSDLRWGVMIDQAAEFLRRLNGTGGKRFELVGHTDPVGTDPFNVDLGRRRAEFIRAQLVRRGVRADMLTIRSEGETSPLAAQAGEAEEQYHARLRRVELIRR